MLPYKASHNLLLIFCDKRPNANAIQTEMHFMAHGRKCLQDEQCKFCCKKFDQCWWWVTTWSLPWSHNACLAVMPGDHV